MGRIVGNPEPIHVSSKNAIVAFHQEPPVNFARLSTGYFGGSEPESLASNANPRFLPTLSRYWCPPYRQTDQNNLNQDGKGGLGALYRAVARIALDWIAARLANELQ